MEKYLAKDNRPSWFPLHHFNEPPHSYATGVKLVRWDQKSLWAFLGMVGFNPIFWNLVARNEYRNKTITKIVRSPYLGCYLLAATIFSLSAFRDSLFLNALRHQPALAILDNELVKVVAVLLFVAGQVFVLSSMWALGVTGTYLGDYFGILMSHRVTGFPFNVLNDPMYVGSAMTHLGTALWKQSPVGIALSFWIFVVYTLALRFEGPFTDKIYSSASKKTDDPTSSSSSQTKSTATGSGTAPNTPRKSSRIASKSSSGGLSENESYADAAAQPPSADGLSSITPRKSRTQALAASARKRRQNGPGGAGTSGSEDDASTSATASPMRMTRSRSRPRMVSDGE